MNDDKDVNKIAANIAALKLEPVVLKDFLRKLVEKTWPAKAESRPWHRERPVIEEMYKAMASAHVVPVFRDEHGVYQVVVGIPGDHIDKRPVEPTHDERKQRKYDLLGGNIDLKETPGSTCVKPDPDKPENPEEGAARELEEEMPTDKKDSDGKPMPVLRVDPARLRILSAVTARLPEKPGQPPGEKSLVTGYMMQLTPEEARTVQNHVKRLDTDPAYHKAVRNNTINPDTKKPEICKPVILPLAQMNRDKLRHGGKLKLFELMAAELEEQRKPGELIGRLNTFTREKSLGDPKAR